MRSINPEMKKFKDNALVQPQAEVPMPKNISKFGLR